MVWKGLCAAVGTGFLSLGTVGCSGAAVDPLVPFTQVSSQMAIEQNTSRLLVENRMGNVTFLAGAVDDVRVDADVRIRQRLAETTAKGGFADHVNVTVSDGMLRVADAHTGRPDEREWGVNLVVRVPARLSIEANNVLGNIEVEGTQADLEVVSKTGSLVVRTQRAGRVEGASGTGDVRVTAVTVDGPVYLASGTGSIALAVTGTPPTRDVILQSGTGGVRLAIPPNSPGRFRMSSGTGSIHVASYSGIQMTKSLVGAEAKGTVGKGGPTYRLSTGTGSIHAE